MFSPVYCLFHPPKAKLFQGWNKTPVFSVNCPVLCISGAQLRTRLVQILSGWTDSKVLSSNSASFRGVINSTYMWICRMNEWTNVPIAAAINTKRYDLDHNVLPTILPLRPPLRPESFPFTWLYVGLLLPWISGLTYKAVPTIPVRWPAWKKTKWNFSNKRTKEVRQIFI